MNPANEWINNWEDDDIGTIHTRMISRGTLEGHWGCPEQNSKLEINWTLRLVLSYLEPIRKN